MKKGFHYGNTLGDYIHLRAENYLKYGTLRALNTGYETGANKHIFTDFQNVILHRAERIDKLRNKSDLKEFEKQFNLQRKIAYQKLQELFGRENGKGDEFKEKFIELLIKKAYNTSDQFNIDEWKEKLVFNSKQGNLQMIKNSEKKLSGIKFDPIYRFQGKTFAYIDTLLGISTGSLSKNGQIRTVRSSINMSKLDADEKAKLHERLDTLEYQLKEIEKKSIEYKKNINIKDSSLAKALNEILESDYGQKQANELYILPATQTGRGRISSDLANWFYYEIQIVNRSLKIANTFKQFQATFSEIMTALVVIGADDFAKDLSDKTVLDIIDKKVKSSDTIKVRSNIEAAAQRAEQKFNLKAGELGTAKIKGAKGKVDATFELNGEVFNASVKNYDLNASSADSFKLSDSTHHVDEISLVKGTPLTTFLLIAETYRPQLGTHFLNALTDDVAKKYSGIRNVALNSLRIFLLYTGLTGGHGDLSVNLNPGADLLVIEEKTGDKVGYCHFFSISSILKDAVSALGGIEEINKNFKNKFYLSAGSSGTYNWDQSLSNIRFLNKREGDKDRPDTNGINARLKKILVEAHSYKMSAALSIKNYIKENIT